MQIRDWASKWRVSVHIKRTTVVRVPGWLSWFSVQVWIWAQVMISQFVGSSPASGSVLTAQGSFYPPPLCPFAAHTHACSLAQNETKIWKKILLKMDHCRARCWQQGTLGVYGGMVYGDSVLSIIFCCELKTSVKIRLIKCIKQHQQQNTVSTEATLSIY